MRRPFVTPHADHNQSGAARDRSKGECFSSSSETVSAGTHGLASRAAAGLALEVAADKSHHGRAPKERGVSPL